MFGKTKQTGAQRIVSTLGEAFDGATPGTMKAVGTAVGSIAVATVGASALINTLRKKEREGVREGSSG